MTSADVNTTYGGSTALKGLNQWYTIEDIAETIGGGGGGLGTFNVTSNGTTGSNSTINYTILAGVNGSNQGVQVYPVVAAANVSLQYDSYSGASFTATELSYPGLTAVAGFTINQTPLVKLSAPDLAIGYGSMAYMQIQNNQFLQELNMPALTSIEGLSISSCQALSTIDFSSLTTIGYGGLSLNYTAITAVTPSSFPVLTNAVGSLTFGGVTSVNMPSIQQIGGVQDNTFTLQSIAFPNLTWLKSSGINLGSRSSLTTVDFGFTLSAGQPKLKRIGSSADALIVYNVLIDLSGCALNTASVDNVITTMVSLDGTNGTVSAMNGNLYLQGGTNSAPGPAGAAALPTLISRGWYIQTN